MTGYNDPKTTAYKDPTLSKPARTGSGKTVWYVAAVIVVLLVLAWAFGMFSGAGDATLPATGSDTITAPADPATPAAPAAPAAPAN